MWEYADHDVEKLDKIIALDTIGPNLWTNPGNIYDGLQMAIMDPIVSLAETVLTTYGQLEFSVNSIMHPNRFCPNYTGCRSTCPIGKHSMFSNGVIPMR